jgi:nucleoside-diphosphate-sugar epimerase
MKSKLKILLTGASGTVGFEVLKQLIEEGNRFDITVFDLKSKLNVKRLSRFKNMASIVYGDISNTADVRKVCAGKDIVIHLAAIIPPLADQKPELAYKVNTIGTGNLVRALEELSLDAFLLYSSSISVYGDRLQNTWIKVDDPLIASDRDEYAKTKIKAEQIIRQSKLNWSIFRLTAIMGGHKVSKLMFHMPLETPLEIATPEDTARAFVNAIDHKEQLLNKTFNLGGGEACRITYHAFLERSFEIFGLGKPDFPPKAFAERNFHCGYYADSDELEKILHFRNDTIDSYFEKVKMTIPAWQKILTRIFKKQVKKRLLRQSEPYQAFLKNNDHDMKHYFSRQLE